jgi:hypothetical protein
MRERERETWAREGAPKNERDVQRVRDKYKRESLRQ